MSVPCPNCGGMRFATNEVAGYAGPICGGNWHSPVTPPPAFPPCSGCKEKDEKDARIMQLGSDLLEMQKAARLIQSAHDAATEDAKKWRRDAQKFAGEITEFRLLLDEIIPYLNEWDHPIYWVERARKLLEETKP